MTDPMGIGGYIEPKNEPDDRIPPEERAEPFYERYMPVPPEETLFEARVAGIISEIELGMKCTVVLERDQRYDGGRMYVQIECERLDVITKKVGFGRGGKFYLSPAMTTNEITQGIFGLYLAYWTHEARETFQWRGRRVYGPHISVEALWEAAPHVDVRSARHVEDRPSTRTPGGEALKHEVTNRVILPADRMKARGYNLDALAPDPRKAD